MSSSPASDHQACPRVHRTSTRSNSENDDYLSNVNRLILIAVDGNESSNRAFEFYFQNFVRDGDGVLLVCVVEPLNTGINYGLATKTALLTEDFSRHIQDLIAEGRELGNGYLQRCKGTGVRARFVLHIGAKPGEHICRVAKGQHVDMVVMGSRGIGRIRRTLLGSVSDYVLHHVGIPVVIVPPPRKDSITVANSEGTLEEAKEGQTVS